jgi:pyocin large subunit-like protein
MSYLNPPQAFSESACLTACLLAVTAATVVLSIRPPCRSSKSFSTKTALCAERRFNSKHLPEPIPSRKKIKGTHQPYPCHKKTDRVVWAKKRENPEKAHSRRLKKHGHAGVRKTFDEQLKHQEALHRHRLEKKTRDNQIKYDRDSKMTLCHSILLGDEENV